MSKLNPRQNEAVKFISGPLLVLAGAGSGKTSVITRKIAYLVEQCGVESKHIAAVTFTNKASREMKERVGQILQGKGKGLTVSTFHNLGMNIIRKEHKRLGLKSGFSLFDDQDSKALLKDLMLHNDEDSDQVDFVRNMISNWKNEMVSPETAEAQAVGPQEILAARAYESYNSYLSAYNAVDFDDLIQIPVKLFDEHPDVLERWQNRIRYLLVDEYQDTNLCQYRMVRQLVGHRGALTVVGDDDQSIYAWRGARPENLEQLQVDFPSLKVVKLEQNYRSTSRILKAANTLIANNPHVFQKTLWSEMGPGDPIRVIHTRNEDAECERIATEILDQHLRKHTPFSDFAILYRGNYQARLLEIKLQAFQVPYKLSGGTSFFARAEIKDLMCYLKVLVNRDNDNAFLRIINLPRREIGPSTLKKLGEYASERQVSLFDACDEIGLEQVLPAAAVEKLRQFTRWLHEKYRQCYESDPIQAIKDLVYDIDYEGWLRQNASSDKVAETRMQNVFFLIDSLKSTLERLQEDDPEAGIEETIARIILMDMLDRQEEEDDSNKVQLMTLHASKGLEFPHVFLMGMEEELLPHRNSIENGDIEEERRLAYVGVTRAKRTLTITLARQRKQFGELLDCAPSRFLDELPQEDLEIEGNGEKNPEVNKQRGRATLNSLRNMFDDL
ncbi:DNA helicase Rep [Neptunomonas japonica]|uniref:ATP-dependent DNA helicase Rep n=1 Tax=Neptunomonas japonica JAMM 1380 TaxID=1441457 RepID=A0A7R6SU75_9GAMM|nr:DNA helicase Rep [Neptunomonas japonica]BBB28184.1 ATP-dependent DNA helicase Rep [Neptunomonas japonica JAMM 1380]